eukprot:CAMPEP_0171730976 /NCGR_PEP_ID=MMETSP0991-20121206/28641_1 /TAXON_ID=483369 /ORGANISM="non described non described, Strain CCMP2098" /LENGTH=237 /DNA_ID=CAMNT_0012325871 /DNA_START=120 /DNA_END=833 /DNA_ORIENTATION=-
MEAKTTQLRQKTKKSLVRIEQTLSESNEVAERTSAQLAIQEETLEAVNNGVKVVEEDIKRTHRLLDKFSWWANFGTRKSRKAGRRGNKHLETEAKLNARKKDVNCSKQLEGPSRIKSTQKTPNVVSTNGEAAATGTLKEATFPKPAPGESHKDELFELNQVSDDELDIDEEDHMDRISIMVARLHDISLEHQDAIQRQKEVISTVEVTSTGQVKRARKAQARTVWHSGKKLSKMKTT